MGKLEGKLLPGENIKKIVSELEIDEEGYIEPYFLEFDFNFNSYLNLSAPINEESNYYANVYVKKIGDKKNDYLVDINNVNNHKWERTEFPFGEEISDIISPENDLPIIKLTSDKYLSEKKSLKDQYNEAIQNEDYHLAERIMKKMKRSKK
ncbi:hypothetical protein HOD29_05640 [archaeon]|jgi:hypothetical protein|nr:hypothetical protein [archaeon]